MAEANILIGTPAYAGQVHVDYVHALLSLYRAGVRFTLMTVDKESHGIPCQGNCTKPLTPAGVPVRIAHR